MIKLKRSYSYYQTKSLYFVKLKTFSSEQKKPKGPKSQFNLIQSIDALLNMQQDLCEVC